MTPTLIHFPISRSTLPSVTRFSIISTSRIHGKKRDPDLSGGRVKFTLATLYHECFNSQSIVSRYIFSALAMQSTSYFWSLTLRARKYYQATIYYGLAVFAASAALLFRAVLSPKFGSHYPYHTVWAAIIFVARYCGLGPVDLGCWN
jgi:hypothetical protein